jgi:Phage integrase, N-terminal SAM-like domain
MPQMAVRVCPSVNLICATFDYLKWFPNGNRVEQFRKGYRMGLTTGEKTIGEYYTQWIETKKPPLVRKSLERDYRQYFSCYILPQIGQVKLKELGHARTLENFKIQLLSRDLSVSTVRRVIDGPFRAMIRDAKKFDDLVIDDPFVIIEWPETPREKPDPFTEAERDAILGYFRQRAAERKFSLRITFLFIACSGPGCALQKRSRCVGAMWTLA